MSFIDEASIEIVAGKGGNGCLSFRREKFIPRGGPDGGDGGHGGSIYFQAEKSLTTLQDFKLQTRYQAKNGSNGQGRDKHGKDAQNLILKVPIGTQIVNEDTDEIICDLTTYDEAIEIAVGGKGGLGNARFKSSTNRAPRKTTEGTNGEKLFIKLELKVLADVGLLGLPNAGKSTFISVISSAKPKIADYPFTTLKPNLGVVKNNYSSFVVADIPGLIPGASDGIGLGIKFLKHLSRVRLLLHLVDVSSFNQQDLIEDISNIEKELELYDSNLFKMERWIVLNKIDTCEEKAKDVYSDLEIKYPDRRLFSISSVTNTGIAELLNEISKNFLMQKDSE